jgi:hypothetical protein
MGTLDFLICSVQGIYLSHYPKGLNGLYGCGDGERHPAVEAAIENSNVGEMKPKKKRNCGQSFGVVQTQNRLVASSNVGRQR